MKGSFEQLKFPKTIWQFIEKSTTNPDTNFFSVNRKSSEQWLLWRKKIKDESLLIDVEENCDSSMKQLGYIKLFNLNRTKEIHLYPSVTDQCLHLPCL